LVVVAVKVRELAGAPPGVFGEGEARGVGGERAGERVTVPVPAAVVLDERPVASEHFADEGGDVVREEEIVIVPEEDDGTLAEVDATVFLFAEGRDLGFEIEYLDLWMIEGEDLFWAIVEDDEFLGAGVVLGKEAGEGGLEMGDAGVGHATAGDEWEAHGVGILRHLDMVREAM
jgi:hypothetical protein